MSVPAPTTFRFGDLPPELADMVVNSLGGDDQRSVAQTSTALRDKTSALYLQNYVQTPGLISTYDASQEDPPAQPTNHYLMMRSFSLKGKTLGMTGGSALVDRVTAKASVFHPDSQLQLAKARWNCKVIGLIPLLKLIPAARACLIQIARIESDQEKYERIIAWIKSHPDDVAGLKRADILRCRKENVQNFVTPHFFILQGKVYNMVPKGIGLFRGLQHLSFYNNLLNEVPPEIVALPLRTLNLGANSFNRMPPVIPTLRNLFIEQNRGRFSFDEVANYIRSYIEKGGEYIKISLDREYFEDERYQGLILEIAAAGTHTLRLELIQGQSVFIVEKNLEATQPLYEE